MFEDEKQEVASSATEAKSEVSDQEEVKSQSEPAEDYKARAEQYRKQAEERLEALKRIQKSKYSRQDEEESESTDEEETAPTAVRRELETWKREQASDTIEDVLNSLSDNPDERDLVRLVYENDIKQTGLTRKQIETDLKKALAIANLPKFEAQVRERTRAEVSKSQAEDKAMTSGSVSSGSGRQPLRSKEPPKTAFDSFVEDRRKRIGLK